MQSSKTRQLDSGWSWVVLACTFSTYFLAQGIVIAGFAVLYSRIVHTYNTNTGSVGFVMTIYSLTSSLPSLGYNSLLKRFGYRKYGFVSALWGGLCIALSSFAPNLIVFAVLVGLAGPGITSAWYISTVAVQNYFDKKRGLAGGIAATGISAGYFAGGPAVQYISEYYGWRGARLIGAAILLNIVVAMALLRPHPENQLSNEHTEDEVVKKEKQSQTQRVRTMSEQMACSTETIGSIHLHVEMSNTSDNKSWLCDLSLLKDPSTSLYLVGCGVSLMGIYTLYFHLPNRCLHIGMTEREAAWMSSLFGICNAAGRLIFTAIVTLTPMSITIQCCVLLLISSLATMAVGLTHGILDSAVVIAITALSLGGHACVKATALRDIAGIKNTPTAFALEILLGGSVGAFATFFAGYIYDITLDYNKSFLICGGIETIGALLVCVSVIIYHRRIKTEKNVHTCDKSEIEEIN